MSKINNINTKSAFLKLNREVKIKTYYEGSDGKKILAQLNKVFNSLNPDDNFAEYKGIPFCLDDTFADMFFKGVSIKKVEECVNFVSQFKGTLNLTNKLYNTRLLKNLIYEDATQTEFWFNKLNKGTQTFEEFLDKSNEYDSNTVHETQRVDVNTSRIIRNTLVGDEVKRIYSYSCQVCGIKLETPSGPYAECCHIKPLGRPHNGPDIIENVLCLCPNHHVMFDAHAFHISDDFRVIETGEKIRLDSNHNIKTEYIQYHRKVFST